MRFFAPGLQALLGYRAGDLRFDLVAGLSVAAVALPVGIAYAEIAQVPAVMGIYAAIFPLFAYALFGSSRELIVGPDAASCMMAAAAVGTLAGGDPARASALMVALSLVAGVLYLLAGLARFGFVAGFLSHPILVGYLNGIALIILVGQLPKLCGVAAAAGGFFPQLSGFAARAGAAHAATLALGLGALALLLALRRWTPRLPGALVVAILAIAAVAAFGLDARGVAVLGAVPGGLPAPRLPAIGADALLSLLNDAAGLALIGFTGGILTAKGFARRRGYDVDADRELIAFGAANLASGLAQGFPVTGTDSRTAVNCAVGGRTHLAGVVAGATMLGFLLFLTAPLAVLPKAALAAIVIVSTLGLFDVAELGRLGRASARELGFSLSTTAGVLVLGVLPGVVLAVALSLVWLLIAMSRPHDAVLGRPPGVEGFHNIDDYPDAATVPGLLIYRFDGDVVFFNCDHLKQRLEAFIAAAPAPVEWVVIDAGPINIVDYTALRMFESLRGELAARGIALGFARVKQSLARFFRAGWASRRRRGRAALLFATVDEAVAAFERRR